MKSTVILFFLDFAIRVGIGCSLFTTVLFAQPTEVAINVVGNPREFVEIAIAKNLTVRQALDKALPKDGIQFVVVARRADVWVGEARTSVERKTLNVNTAVIVANAAQAPVHYETATTVSSIKQTLATEFSGDVVFRVQYLTDPSVGVERERVLNPITPPIYRPMPTDLRRRDGSKTLVVVPKDNSDGPTTPSEVLASFIWIVSILGGTGMGIGLWAKNREKKKEQIRKTLEEMEEVNSKKEQDVRFKRLLVDDVQTFLNCILIVLLMSNTTKAFAQFSSDTSGKIVVLDVSGSATWMSLTAKEVIAADLLRGKHTHLWITGDSTRFVKEIRTLGQLDSVFARLPVDKRTRLSESFASIVHIADSTRKKGQKVSIAFISDWDSDDNNNSALRYLPSIQTIPADSLTSVSTTGFLEPIESNLEIVLIAVFVALVVVFVGIRVLRKNDTYRIFKSVVLSNGKRQVEFSLEELKQRRIKLANTVDADLRVFDDREQFVRIDSKPGSIMVTLEQLQVDPLTISFNERR